MCKGRMQSSQPEGGDSAETNAGAGGEALAGPERYKTGIGSTLRVNTQEYKALVIPYAESAKAATKRADAEPLSVNPEDGGGLLLELTEAWEGVELFVNGRSAEIQIAKPYRYDLTEYILGGSKQSCD